VLGCGYLLGQLCLAQLPVAAGQSSEDVRRVILVVRVLQQSFPLVRSRAVCYFRAHWLRNRIRVHRFVHGIGKVTLQNKLELVVVNGKSEMGLIKYLVLATLS